MADFQTQVNTQPAPAVAGDFASANPRFTVDAGPGGLVAGASGVRTGLFAWWDNATNTLVSNVGAGPVTGFVAREQQALITGYLNAFSVLIPAGFGVTLFSGGDFWVLNQGTAEAQVGMKAYATLANGRVTFALTGTPTNGATSTASSIAPATGSFTGSIAGNVMTLTNIGSGTAVVGGILSGTGVAAGTQILAQLTGSAGSTGTYTVTPGEQTVASTTISETYGTLTVGGTLTGSFAVNDTISGSGGGGVTTGTTITALGSGSGGAGTYIVNLTQTVTSSAINAQSNVETKWIAMTSGLTGELVKISSMSLG